MTNVSRNLKTETRMPDEDPKSNPKNLRCSQTEEGGGRGARDYSFRPVFLRVFRGFTISAVEIEDHERHENQSMNHDGVTAIHDWH
jgi:hypothetical protein